MEQIFAGYESWAWAAKVYFGIALASSLILVVQMLLSLLGAAHHGVDADVSGDVDLDGSWDVSHELAADHDSGHALSGTGGLAYFSLNSITAFLCLFGWTGFALTRGGVWGFATLVVAMAAGSAALVSVAYMLRFFCRMSISGNVDIRDAIGEVGTVYLVIPQGVNVSGAVNVTVGEALREFKAVAEDGSEIKTGTKVKITGALDPRTLIVRPASPSTEWLEVGI